MQTRTEWAVALLGNLVNGNPEIIVYPSREVAQVAAETWHVWDIPLVIHREVPEWIVDRPERDQTLTDAVEIFERSQSR
jgi:hypothetical protein